MSRGDREGQRRGEVESDAMTLVSRALEMARRRMRYRIGAALIVAATLVATVLLLHW